MRPVIILLCLIYFFSCKGADKFRPELQSKIDILSKETTLDYNDSALVSYFKDSCSKDELMRLINYKVPIIRILAYRAIVDRNEGNFFQILKGHLSDTSKVTWFYYDDSADDFMISDLMIRKSADKLTRQQKDTLIDLVLTKHIYLGTAKWMIDEMKPNEKYYSIIKEQTKLKSGNCHDIQLVLAIARFKKRNDVAFLKSKLNNLTDNPYCNDHIFKAIAIFPDSAFFPILQNYFDNYIIRKKQSAQDDLELYCRAVAQYKNKQAVGILKALTESSTYQDDEYLLNNKESVFKAIHKYDDSIYSNLCDQLMPQMDKSVFDFMNISLRDWNHPTW